MLLSIFAGLALPALLLSVLPLFGGDTLRDLLTGPALFWGLGLLLLAAGYVGYFRCVCKRPAILALGGWLLYPWLIFTCHHLSQQGVPVSHNLLTVLLLLLPAFWIGLRQPSAVRKQVSYLNPFIWFMELMVGYFLFFQESILDQRSDAGAFTLGFYYLLALLIHLAQIVLTVEAVRQSQDKRFLDRVDSTVALGVFAIAMVGLLMYQSEHFSILDGFTRRAKSIFEHPAYLAHYIALSVLYLLPCLGQHPASRLRWLGVAAAILVGVLSLLLSLSKAAIFMLIAVLLMLGFLLNPVPSARLLKNAKILLIAGLLVILSTKSYEACFDVSLLDGLMQRISERASLDWRERATRYLLADIDEGTLWLGHGMSAAKGRMAMFEGFRYDATQFALSKVVHVHNGYLSQLYDYGLPGLSMFVILTAMAARRLVDILKAPSDPSRLWKLRSVCLILYFLGVCATETLFELPVSPFWFLLTGAVLREARA